MNWRAAQGRGAMSDPRKLPPDQAWDALRSMALRDEAERVESLSSEELAREVAAMGRDPEVEKAKALALVAKYKKGGQAPAGVGVPPVGPVASPAIAAPVIPMTARKPRSRTLVWLLAAAFGVMAVVLFAKRQDIMALLRPHAPGPDEIRPDDHAAYAQAVHLRSEARDQCDQRLWLTCRDRLDQAARLDPAGESSEAVKALRATIASHVAHRPPDASPFDEKTPVP